MATVERPIETVESDRDGRLVGVDHYEWCDLKAHRETLGHEAPEDAHCETSPVEIPVTYKHRKPHARTSELRTGNWYVQGCSTPGGLVVRFDTALPEEIPLDQVDELIRALTSIRAQMTGGTEAKDGPARPSSDPAAAMWNEALRMFTESMNRPNPA